MGKASSSKKVARAAGIGSGRSHRRQTPWGYFGVIGLIVALGLVGAVFSRNQRNNAIAEAGTSGGVTVGSTNFEAYAIDICGTFVPPVKTPAANPHGITAYTPAKGTTAPADGGVIQIEPTSKDYAGKNATLGKFTSAVGITLNAAALQMPGGKQYLANSTTCDGKTGVVYIKQFSSAQDSVGQLYNGAKGQLAKLNPVDVPIGPANSSSQSPYITIAFVPPSWASAACPASTSPSTTTSTTTPSSTTTGSANATTTTTRAPTSTTTTASTANPTTVTGCIPPPNADVDSLLTAAQTAAASSATSTTTVP